MTTIIAEIASAHCGDINLCKDLIDASLDAGADHVKLQVWDPSEGDFAHMMDKHISFDDWSDIISPYPEMSLIGQYYGAKSWNFCMASFIHRMGADKKFWECAPVIGHQLYPTPIGESRVHQVEPGYGYADHSFAESAAAYMVPALAIARGATMIEKHICMDREKLKSKSKDWVSSLEPREFKDFVNCIRAIDIR